ncbi:MAG: hypothetical protein ACFFEF_13875 [Candidatus Thorarchaeota archaeon]
MAHEGFTIVLVFLGVVLFLGYYFGPKNEVRKIKRVEGKIMLLPTGIILIILALVVFSGILDIAP